MCTPASLSRAVRRSSNWRLASTTAERARLPSAWGMPAAVQSLAVGASEQDDARLDPCGLKLGDLLLLIALGRRAIAIADDIEGFAPAAARHPGGLVEKLLDLGLVAADRDRLEPRIEVPVGPVAEPRQDQADQSGQGGPNEESTHGGGVLQLHRWHGLTHSTEIRCPLIRRAVRSEE